MAAIGASTPTPHETEHRPPASDWSGKGWRITVTGSGATIVRGTDSISLSSTEAPRVDVRRRWFRWLLYEDGEVIVRLRGINRLHASELARAFRHLALAPSVADAIAWHAAVDDVLARGRAEQRWIPTEAIDALLATRPEPRLLERLRVAETESILREQERDAVALLDADLDALFAATNEAIMSTELASLRPFFDTIEKSPLTDEQARAVVCFDNRVQVLAAAGSGKTSVMVARAAYAVRRGFVAPDRILLLAFNKAAAAELQQRVAARFEAAGIDFTGVEASTFHRFGLRLLGQATRRKPRLAKWVEQEREVDTVLRIVDELRDATESFRYNWDLYRLLFANKPTKLAENEPDAHDTSTGRSGYRTFGGDIVKSHGERTIADFLYLNGVRYLYEQPYAVDVADTMHSQYRPDFYYPDIDVWHEHWLLIATAEPLKSSRATRKP